MDTTGRWREILGARQRGREILGPKIREVLVVLSLAMQASMTFLPSVDVSYLEDLRRVLLRIRGILEYIELHGGTASLGWQPWIEHVALLVDHARYLVQGFISPVDGEGAQGHKVSNFFPASFNSDDDTSLEIEATREELVDVLYSIPISHYLELNEWRLVESEDYFGMGSRDVDTVVDNLLDDDEAVDVHGDQQIEVVAEQPVVVSIVGLAGIGKTTLANLIFKNERVMGYFNWRVWVGGLHDFNLSRITESILIPSSTRSSAAPIGGKRLLLVLDGVLGGVVGDKWEKLKDVVRRSGFTRGSCIIVTTRFENVAREMGTSYFHYLKPLSEDICWSLFAHKALWGRSKHECSVRVDFASKIMKQSGGVPFFVNALGYIWESPRAGPRLMHESQNGTLDNPPSEYKNVLSPILKQGYDSLPPKCKECFLICSLFPKNSWIEKRAVIQMWMALDSMRQDEVECSQHFDELMVKTSFFKDLERDDVDGSLIKCRMHPPAHDFASCSKKDETFIKIKVRSITTSSTDEHLSLICKKDTTSIQVNTEIGDTDNVRSLLIFGNSRNLEVSPDVFARFHNLKVLDLGGSGITWLHDSLGKLKYLKYLNLSSTKISKLPKSIGDLSSLEILKLSYSTLQNLPEEITLLTSLRHLEIEGTCLKFLPKGIGSLTNLQKLSDFIIGVQRGASIRELGDLNQLQGRLVISNLNELTSRDEAKKAKLNKKKDVNCLELDGLQAGFDYQSMELKKFRGPKVLKHLYNKVIKFKRSREPVEKVFEGFEPHEGLKSLEIRNYIGDKFPGWMEKSSVNLVSLKLTKCGMVVLLPPLGALPFLKHLHIHSMGNLKHLGHEHYKVGNVGGFPKLECLTFEEMSSWEKWDLSVQNGEMPCLTKLLLRHCPVLLVLPHLPETLTELALHGCSKLETLSGLPKALKTFALHHCPMLKTLPDLPASMRKLVLIHCDSLLALPPLPKALRELVLHYCTGLEPVKYLPYTLRELGLSSWSVLASPPQLPDTLKVLNICDYSEPKWNLDTSLLQLEHFGLACKDKSLRSLPKLSNLVSLKIMMSSELASLPSELSQLNSLKTLSIHFCPKLRSLPEELQQLTNLQKLFIIGCRHLKERYQMEKGHDWHKISHVPYIKIDDKIQPQDFFSQSLGHH